MNGVAVKKEKKIGRHIHIHIHIHIPRYSVMSWCLTEYRIFYHSSDQTFFQRHFVASISNLKTL